MTYTGKSCLFVCLLLPLHKTNWFLFPSRPFFFMTTKFSTLKVHHHVHKLRGENTLKQFMFNTKIYIADLGGCEVYNRSLDGIVCSNLARTSMFVGCECCVLSGVSAMSLLLVQRSPMGCSASLCVISKPQE